MPTNQTIQTPQSTRTRRVLMFNISPWLADFLYDVFTVVLVFGVFAVVVGPLWPSDALTFVGAFTTAIGTYGSIKFGALKEYFSNERISENERMTADANAEAGRANEAAGKAKERAANAELALAKFRAPRALSREQRIKISTQLLPFGDTKFDVGISSPNPEILNLNMWLASALKEARWELINWDGGDVGFTLTGGEFLGITSARDITVQIGKGAPKELSDAAGALVSTLIAEGLEAIAEFNAVPASKNPNTVHVLIGPKT